MLHVGLTGNVASGKSAVARVWASRGVPVLDADRLAREAVVPGSPGLAAVRDAFGDAVIAEDGSLDRARMRAIVFRDPVSRKRLERILHPIIERLRRAWAAERRAEGAPIAVSEVPLLFEAGLEGAFDRIVLVDAPEEMRLQRLVDDRGLSPEEARRVMAAQDAAAGKRARADHVIVNDGTLESLEEEALALLERLRAEPSL
jgi:dephospho-CoA kinase